MALYMWNDAIWKVFALYNLNLSIINWLDNLNPVLKWGNTTKSKFSRYRAWYCAPELPIISCATKLNGVISSFKKIYLLLDLLWQVWSMSSGVQVRMSTLLFRTSLFSCANGWASSSDCLRCTDDDGALCRIMLHPLVSRWKMNSSPEKMIG